MGTCKLLRALINMWRKLVKIEDASYKTKTRMKINKQTTLH